MAAASTTLRKQTVPKAPRWHKGWLENCQTFCLSQHFPTLPSSLLFQKYKDLFVGRYQRNQHDPTSSYRWFFSGLEGKAPCRDELLRNRHRHWTDPSHFALPGCCWQQGSPEVSSLRRVPTAPPLHPCPFITLRFLFSSW